MNICLYFQVHQPFRLLDYSFFNIGKNHFYENAPLNQLILNRVADNCYLKANEVIKRLIHENGTEFKISFSLSGILIEQLELYRPDVLESFKELNKTGCVEFLSETYNHSLSFLYSEQEFKRQVNKHRELIKQHFNQDPVVFRNTELIYNNNLAVLAEEMGFTGILTEGVDRILKGRNTNKLYKSPSATSIKCLLRNTPLSESIAFRFTNQEKSGIPLSAQSFVESINTGQKDQVINLFMNYETFGEHQPFDSGIFKFLSEFPKEFINKGHSFLTVSEVITKLEAKDVYDASDFISWKDTEKDLSPWMSNSMQYEALQKIYAIQKEILATDDENLIQIWTRLQTSDHFYFMCTKYHADSPFHKYFNPYNSPYDAYIFYMNILSDLEITLKKALK